MKIKDKNNAIHLVFDGDLKEQLSVVAKKKGLNLSAFIRLVLTDFLKKEDKDD